LTFQKSEEETIEIQKHISISFFYGNIFWLAIVTHMSTLRSLIFFFRCCLGNLFHALLVRCVLS